MNIEQRELLGFAQLNSFPILASEIADFKDSHFEVEGEGISDYYAFNITWLSKTSVGFDSIKFIRNELNNNNPVNMCREFNVL